MMKNELSLDKLKQTKSKKILCDITKILYFDIIYK